MWKWFLLIIGVIMLSINSWGIYDMYQPKVGPIGNGKIATHVWVLIINGYIMVAIAIIQFFILLAYERKKKDVKKEQTR